MAEREKVSTKGIIARRRREDARNTASGRRSVQRSGENRNGRDALGRTRRGGAQEAQETQSETDGDGLGAKRDGLMVSTPRQHFRLTPWRNRLRAFWDSRSKARVLADESGQYTTEMIETYIKFCMRADNLQWIECMKDNREALIELFSKGGHAVFDADGQGDTASSGGAEGEPVDMSTAEKAKRLRRARSKRDRAIADAKLVEQIRIREDFAREIVAMEQARVSEYILQYWRVFRHFSPAGGDLPVSPKLPDASEFTGEQLYRAHVSRLREEAASDGLSGGLQKISPFLALR